MDNQQTGEGKLIAEDLTYRIRACIFAVSNELGPGFLERVYENALAIELSAAGLAVRTQCPIHVHYKGQIVGEYIADLVVEGQVLLELKAIRGISGEHEAQIMNYLRATRLKVGLLVNFGQPSVQIKRFVL
jgi:GxxExxY protein